MSCGKERKVGVALLGDYGKDSLKKLCEGKKKDVQGRNCVIT